MIRITLSSYGKDICIYACISLSEYKLYVMSPIVNTDPGLLAMFFNVLFIRAAWKRPYFQTHFYCNQKKA